MNHELIKSFNDIASNGCHCEKRSDEAIS